jgi:microcystin degradation protein MlrC
LTELPVWTIDPEHYRCVGLFPERMKFVVIKSQGSFKASYDKISKIVFYLDTPGASSSNINKLPFSRINKNELYPFNKHLDFSPNPVIF